MSETQSEERATQPTHYACSTCKDQGWWVDGEAQKRGEKFFFYCTCAAGIRAEDEDGEGGD